MCLQGEQALFSAWSQHVWPLSPNVGPLLAHSSVSVQPQNSHCKKLATMTLCILVIAFKLAWPHRQLKLVQRIQLSQLSACGLMQLFWSMFALPSTSWHSSLYQLLHTELLAIIMHIFCFVSGFFYVSALALHLVLFHFNE